MEGRGFKSHLGLKFFSESSFLLTFNIIVVNVVAVVVVVSSLTYSIVFLFAIKKDTKNSHFYQCK